MRRVGLLLPVVAGCSGVPWQYVDRQMSTGGGDFACTPEGALVAAIEDRASLEQALVEEAYSPDFDRELAVWVGVFNCPTDCWLLEVTRVTRRDDTLTVHFYLNDPGPIPDLGMGGSTWAIIAVPATGWSSVEATGETVPFRDKAWADYGDFLESVEDSETGP